MDDELLQPGSDEEGYEEAPVIPGELPAAIRKLTWDNIGERFYKAGLDRGVIYLMRNDSYESGIAWSGLTGIDDNSAGREKMALYTSDFKRALLFTPYEHAGTIKCFTYPLAFEECIGNAQLTTGLLSKGSDGIPFGFTYRTKIGNDLNKDAGYEIHIVYRAYITEAKDSTETLGRDVKANEFSFSYESVCEDFSLGDPVSHLVINSMHVSSDKLSALEKALYGSNDSNPYLPLPDEIYSMLYDRGDAPEEQYYPSDSRYPANGVYPMEP